MSLAKFSDALTLKQG
jgi:hypothetical protein